MREQAGNEEEITRGPTDLVCPFTPYISTYQRSFTCIGEHCQMWSKKKKDCGLKNAST